MKASTLGLVLAISIAIAAACRPPPIQRSTKVHEITQLWIQIRQWRQEAEMPVEPRREDVMSMSKSSVKTAAAVCPVGHTVPDTCSDVCSLADAICDNAEQICILADELGTSDKWAQEKCDNAKASCRDAKKLCCQCSEPAKASSAW